MIAVYCYRYQSTLFRPVKKEVIILMIKDLYHNSQKNYDTDKKPSVFEGTQEDP